MAFYLRKSVSVGPFRFNLSGSGVGVSVGVRGVRVGSGPRGNYVSIGRSGLHYRRAIATPRTPRLLPPASVPELPSGTHGQFQEIESGDATQIVCSSTTMAALAR